MSESVAAALFQSRARAGVLGVLFRDGRRGSVSELARRVGLSPRAVSREVAHLQGLDLVQVERVGTADLVSANLGHPVARPLKALLGAPAKAAPDTLAAKRVRESLAGWGAPLAGVRAVRHVPLEEAILQGLAEGERDATVLRVLPTVLARNGARLDWTALREGARRQRLQAVLGMLVELTGALAGHPDWAQRVAELKDRRVKRMRFYPAVKSAFEAELARQRSPEVARRWGLWMNVSEESFRGTLERHHA